jgi:hypothetical protein
VPASKKRPVRSSALRATLGHRTHKPGQESWFIGYKKHTLRLWLPTRHPSVSLVPLVSWVAPAHVSEGLLLTPSLRWCQRQLGWWPGILVGDLAYVGAEAKRVARQQWQTAVVTRLRSNMRLQAPYQSAQEVACPQGQKLLWWEHEPESGLQWFRVPEESTLCPYCWEAAQCPRHFGYPAAQHETLFGLLPLASQTAQRLLQQVRPWIEPAQSFEKNQLGLSQMFFNSLRLAWQMSLWADSAVLLRTMAWLDLPRSHHLLASMNFCQIELGLEDRKKSNSEKRDFPL